MDNCIPVAILQWIVNKYLYKYNSRMKTHDIRIWNRIFGKLNSLDVWYKTIHLVSVKSIIIIHYKLKI